MATPDFTTAAGRVRWNLGDTSDYPWLVDEEIEYSLTYNNNNENAATKQCAQVILGKMSYQGHERLDKLEFWGETVFNQFRTFLKDIVNNPVYSGGAGIYVGGLNLEDARNNKLDTTIIQHKLPVYPYNDYSDPDETVLGVYQDSSYF